MIALGIAAALSVALVPQGSPNAEAAKIKAKKEPKKMFNAFANFGDIKGESTDKDAKRRPRIKRR
jgi:hypothetical protein